MYVHQRLILNVDTGVSKTLPGINYVDTAWNSLHTAGN